MLPLILQASAAWKSPKNIAQIIPEASSLEVLSTSSDKFVRSFTSRGFMKALQNKILVT